MKRRRAKTPFIEKLREAIKSIRLMRPGEVHVVSVNANYGHYQIIIKPIQGKGSPLEKRIEINGEIHHLFLSPKKLAAQPSKRQMIENLKDTVIMKSLNIHIMDPKGDGRHLSIPEHSSGMHAIEYINLAGQGGNDLVDNAEHSRKYSLAAYRIIQNDILKALKKKQGSADRHH